MDLLINLWVNMPILLKKNKNFHLQSLGKRCWRATCLKNRKIRFLISNFRVFKKIETEEMLVTKTPQTIRDNYLKTKPYFQSFNLSRKKAIKKNKTLLAYSWLS